MKVVKVLGVLLGCPIVGAVVGGVIGALLLPPDASGRGTPGDGILLLWCVGIGLLVSALVALVLIIHIIDPQPDRKRA